MTINSSATGTSRGFSRFKLTHFISAKAQKCYCGTPSCKGVIGVQKKAPEVAPQAADGDEEEEEWASESDSEDEDDSTVR